MAPRPGQREYETAISSSPVRHALINRPFSNIRRRTENLLDQITGGTLSPDVVEQERRNRERDRLLKCKACKMQFADDLGLSRHYNLFPTHINFERKKKQVHKDGNDRPVRHRSQSTPMVLHQSTSPSDVAFVDAYYSTTLPQNTSFSAIKTHNRAYSTDRLASEFYQDMPCASLDHRIASSPYAIANSMAFPRPAPQPPIDSRTVVNPGVESPLPYDEVLSSEHFPLPNSANVEPPLLPSFDFEARFHAISTEGEVKPPTSRPVEIEEPQYDPIGDRNRQAGYNSVVSKARLARRENRALRRGASDGNIDALSMPASFGGVLRAIKATADAGDDSAAVFPEMSTSVSAKSAQHYVPLYGDDKKQASVAEKWESVLQPLPGAYQYKGKSSVVHPISPSLTGVTSFSDDQEFTATGSPPQTLRPRRNTNPFLNREFMQSLPKLKTPPLSPSSPFSSSVRNSPGNPFVQLHGEEDAQEIWYDADLPKTPLDGLKLGDTDKQAVVNGKHYQDLEANDKAALYTLPFTTSKPFSLHNNQQHRDAVVQEVR